MMRYSLFVLLAVAVSLTHQQDAEILPSNIPRGSDSGGRGGRGGDDDGILIVNVRPVADPLTTFFNRIFRSSLFPSRRDEYPLVRDTPTFFPDIPPLFPADAFDFPTIDDFIPIGIPNFGDLPDDYHNSTHDVTVVNGTKIESNTTIIKNKDDNGVYVQEVHIIRYSPEKEDTPQQSPNTPKGDLPPTPEVSTSDDNEIPLKETDETNYEDFGISSIPLIRKRRWVMPEFLQRLFGRSKSTTTTTSTPKPTTTTPSTTPSSAPFRSYFGDTRVNYINNNNKNIENDAEIFDPKTLMNDRPRALDENLENNRISHFHSSAPIVVPSTTSFNHRTRPVNHHRRPIPIREEEETNVNSLSSNPRVYRFQRYHHHHSHNGRRFFNHRRNL